jgi:hypothetical protein
VVWQGAVSFTGRPYADRTRILAAFCYSQAYLHHPIAHSEKIEDVTNHDESIEKNARSVHRAWQPHEYLGIEPLYVGMASVRPERAAAARDTRDIRHWFISGTAVTTGLRMWVARST